MFVNSCLFKSVFCMNPCICLCLQYVFFFFSFRVKLYIAMDTWAVFFQRPVLSEVFVTTCVKRNWGSYFFFFFFFYITIWQNCCSHKKNALSSNQQVVETMNDKALCWRQHLTLHMKTLCYPTAFELPTLSLHYRKTFGQKESNLFSL